MIVNITFESYSIRKLCKLLPHNIIKMFLGYSYLGIIKYQETDNNLCEVLYDHVWVDNIEDIGPTDTMLEIRPTTFGYHIIPTQHSRIRTINLFNGY